MYFYVHGDKPGSKNGWDVLFDNGNGILAGKFGSWRTGLEQTWCSRSSSTTDPKEQRRIQEAINKAKRLRDQALTKQYQDGAQRAHSIWGKSKPAFSHPYLAQKQVKPHGLRDHQGNLLVPLYNTQDQIQTLQFIDQDGDKRFLRMGHKGKSCVGPPGGKECPCPR